MKQIFTIFLTLILTNSLFAQNSNLLFYDDFEETIDNDAVLTNWTTENLEGWQYWHLIPWNGINGSQCVRFENTENQQNDWLITKPISTRGAEKLVVRFSHFHNSTGTNPKLLYTSNYNGTASECNWTSIDYSLGENEGTWYNSNNIVIETPGETVWFAFQYEAAGNQGVYVLIDNFEVSGYTPANYTFSDSSDYFVFHTAVENGENYWNEIAENIDNWYKELCSYWDRPLHDSLFSNDFKIQIYLLDKTNYTEQTGKSLYDWKYGDFVAPDKIYLTLPDGDNDIIYKNSFSKLAKNILGQLILKKRDEINGDQFPEYFYESFGLYYSGFRPDRNTLLQAINQIGRNPAINDINDLNNFGKNKLNLLASYIESQILVRSFQFLYPNDEITWAAFLKHYYLETNEEKRMSLRFSSLKFDFYTVPSDTVYLKAMAQRLEELFVHYTTETFQINIENRFNVVIYPDKNTGEDIHGNYSMGITMGGDNFNIISPSLSENPIQAATGGLIGHEFWHVVHYHLRPYNGYPGGYFIMEGMADYMPSGTIDMRRIDDLWKIESLFYDYNAVHGGEPTLEYIMNNPQIVEPYLFGQLFFNNLIPKIASYEELKNFFITRCDWSVFNHSYTEIEKSYIQYLKSLINAVPQDTIVNLPFNENFDDFYNGWIKPNYLNQDNWQIDNGGISESNYARFYTHSDKNLPIESWLVSPALNTSGYDNVKFSFDFSSYGQGIELNLFYTKSFNGNIESTTWKPIKTVEMQNNWQWSNTGDLSVDNQSDTLFIGLQMKTTGEQHLQLYIDNFKVNGKITNAGIISEIADEFKIYPNPISNQSVISFENQTFGKVSLSVFDIQGRLVSTLIDEKLDIGKYKISIGNSIPRSGIYFCKLSKNTGNSTIKFVVK